MVFGSNPIVGALSPVNFHLHDEIIETCVHSFESFIWIEIAHFYFIRTFDRKVYLTTLNENVVRERCDDTLWNYILCIITYIGKASKISNLVHDINDKSMTTKERYKLRTSWSIEHVYKPVSSKDRPLAAASRSSSVTVTRGRTRPIFFSHKEASSFMLRQLQDGRKCTDLLRVRKSSAAFIVNFPISDPATK